MEFFAKCFHIHLYEFWHIEIVETQLYRTNSLHHSLFKGSTDGHNLTGRFHLSTQSAFCVNEFIESPFWELNNLIVNRWLKASVGVSGYCIYDLVQSVADSNLRSNFCDWITGCFGCQCGRTGYTRVYLDNSIFFGGWMQCKLTVAAALYAQLFNNVQRCFSQHGEFFRSQSYCRSNNDGVTGMNTNWVNVFHRANSDAVSLGVTNYLEFDLFPTGNTFFNQNLSNWRQTQTIGCDFIEIFPSVCDTAAGTTHGECRTNDHWQTNFFRKSLTIFQSCNNFGRNAWLTDGFHGILEHLAVFCFINGFYFGAQQFYTMCIQETFFCQLHREGQTSLTTQVRQNRVWFFNFNDALYNIKSQWLNVNFICHGLIGHDSCRVGVDQNNFQTFFFQSTASLSTGIVELSCLTDDDWAGANHQYFLNILSQWHSSSPSLFLDHAQECFVNTVEVFTADLTFRNELYGQTFELFIAEAFTGLVIGVHMGHFCLFRTYICYIAAMVLSCNEGSAAGQFSNRTVSTTMTSLHFYDLAASQFTHHLMAQADTQHWNAGFLQFCQSFQFFAQVCVAGPTTTTPLFFLQSGN